jgi:hypothetical protein
MDTLRVSGHGIYIVSEIGFASFGNLRLNMGLTQITIPL